MGALKVPKHYKATRWIPELHETSVIPVYPEQQEGVCSIHLPDSHSLVSLINSV